eukprot:1701946-Alexandrium_andersonii.AAC.1
MSPFAMRMGAVASRATNERGAEPTEELRVAAVVDEAGHAEELGEVVHVGSAERRTCRLRPELHPG